MEIRVSQEQGRVPVTVFHIEGDIAAGTYEVLEAQAKQAIQSGSRHILLDLVKVPYVSSYGIRGISQIFTWLREADGEDTAKLSSGIRDGTYTSCCLKLVNPSRQVLQALTTAGIDMFLEIHNDMKKAIASF
ncbi:MAG TPA: STAS domain-containing protein [Anaerolineaceae bacterium]|nr:STAS domain-containing protein [Anaerolineaceae bacterium]